MDRILAESLAAVADTGAVTSAAERVHISPSALSRRLQQLESDPEALSSWLAAVMAPS